MMTAVALCAVTTLPGDMSGTNFPAKKPVDAAASLNLRAVRAFAENRKFHK